MTAIVLATAVFMFMGWRLVTLWQQPATEPVPAAEAPLTGLARVLASVQIGIAPGIFVLGVMLLAGTAGLAILEFFPGQTIPAMITAGACLMTAFFCLYDVSVWRANRFENQLLDALDLMQAVLRNGSSTSAALKVAAEACTGPVARELKEIQGRLEMGFPMPAALARVRLRYNAEGVRLFCHALESGFYNAGEFPRLLDAISGVIRQRSRLRLKIAGQLSGTRYAAWLAGLLPYLLVPVFLSKEPEWLNALLRHPYGATMIATAIACQVCGYLWMRYVLRVKL